MEVQRIYLQPGSKNELHLKIYLRLLGNNHISVANTYCNIAQVCERQKNFEFAHDCYKKCLDIELSILGSSHMSTNETIGNVTRLAKILGKKLD
jgi:hypothetical protein